MTRAVLDDVRVLDLAWLGPGPFLARALGDLGADVIRIEEVEPGRGRRGASLSEATPTLLHEPAVNAARSGERNIRRAAINLKAPEGRDVFLKLAATADVIVEGFRPGVVSRLGIDEAACRRANPSIVYVSISGYGQDGPYAARVGHDANYLAIGGVLGLTGRPDGPPALPGFPAADHAAGAMSALSHILAALLRRERFGAGAYVDLSITDAVVTLAATFIDEYVATEVVPQRGRTGITGLWPWYDVYETRDARWISIAAVEPFFYANLCDAIDRPDLRGWQWERDRWPELRVELEATFRRRSLDEWCDTLEHLDVCAAPVLSIDEVVTDPHLRHRRVIEEVAHPRLRDVLTVAPVVRLDGQRVQIRCWANSRGEHTEEVLEELGLTAGAVRGLVEAGVVGRRP